MTHLALPNPNTETGWLVEWGPKLEAMMMEMRETQLDQEVRLREVHNWMARKEGPNGDIARFYAEQERHREEMAARVLRLEKSCSQHEKDLAHVNASSKRLKAIGAGGGAMGIVAIIVEVVRQLMGSGAS